VSNKRSDDALAAETGRRLLRLLAASALAGGALRGGLSVLRSGTPRYEAPEVPKPLVVDMPYATPDAPPGAAIPPAGKERKALKAANDPDWTKYVPFGKSIHEALPTYTPPLGKPGETNPENVPLYGAMSGAALVGGGLGGYHMADRLLRAADRWRARRDLDAARREYQESVVRRLAGSELAKTAADARVKRALEALYAVVKRAGAPESPPAAPAPEGPGTAEKVITSALWPGLVAGPLGGRINAALALAAGMGGGYMGYNALRDADQRDATRKAVRDVDRANAARIPAPMVMRLVPVPAGRQ
jgi:hypothetical protein